MIRLRQVALVARDLAAAEAEVEGVLDVELCFRDPGVAEFGLVNALYPVGDSFVEIVSPTQDGTTAGRLLERRGGNGGYMVLVQTDDLDSARARIEESDTRIVHIAQGSTICGLHLHPRDVGGAIVSIDRSDPPEDWEWAGSMWRDHVRTAAVTALAAVEVQANEPAAMAARWAAVIGGGLDADGVTLRFDQGAVRFVAVDDDRGEGVSGIDVVAADPARRGEVRHACGTRICFV